MSKPSTPIPASARPQPVLKPLTDKEARLAVLTFEQALGEIEAIIERIEAGEVGLEDSLKEYERGVQLVNHCKGKLDRAQQQVEDLTQKLERADDTGPATSPQDGRGPAAESGDGDESVPF